jgi:hypothetical protein
VYIRFSIPLLARDAGKIAHGRFKSSDLLMGKIDQAIQAVGFVQRPAMLMTGGIYK